MLDDRLISYAQNAEDVVLWRALGHLERGVYVDIGGYDPDIDSVTRIFYERGWRGIDVEPVPKLAEKFRVSRPGNEVVEAAITDAVLDEVVLHWFDETGLSTLAEHFIDRHLDAGHHHQEIRVPARRLDDVLENSTLVSDTIHFLKVDVEGAEEQVLRSIDLERWRPWVLVIEATEPNSTKPSHQVWEPMVLNAGYTLTLFDGLSRFYVSPDRPELKQVLSYPACPFDHFVNSHQAALAKRLDEIGADVARQNQAEQAALASATHWRELAAQHESEVTAVTQARQADAAEATREVERLKAKNQRSRQVLKQVRRKRNRLRDRQRRSRLRIAELTERIDRIEHGAEHVTLASRLRRRLRRV